MTVSRIASIAGLAVAGYRAWAVGCSRTIPRPLLWACLCTIWAASAWAGVPFVTDDADTPDAKHFEINIAGQYTRFQGGSVGTIPSVEVNYGVTDKLQVSVLMPIGFSQVQGVGTNVGLGDTELGVKYRFMDADDWGWKPGIAFAPTVTLPSGIEERGLGAGHFQVSLPIWLSKDFNKWTAFGGHQLQRQSGSGSA